MLEGVAVSVGTSVAVFVADAVSVFVAVAVAVLVSVAVADAVSVAVTVAVSLGVAVGVSLAVAVAVAEGVTLGLAVAVSVGTSVAVPDAVGVSVGTLVGEIGMPGEQVGAYISSSTPVNPVGSKRVPETSASVGLSTDRYSSWAAFSPIVSLILVAVPVAPLANVSATVEGQLAPPGSMPCVLSRKNHMDWLAVQSTNVDTSVVVVPAQVGVGVTVGMGVAVGPAGAQLGPDLR